MVRFVASVVAGIIIVVAGFLIVGSYQDEDVNNINDFIEYTNDNLPWNR